MAQIISAPALITSLAFKVDTSYSDNRNYTMRTDFPQSFQSAWGSGIGLRASGEYRAHAKIVRRSHYRNQRLVQVVNCNADDLFLAK